MITHSQTAIAGRRLGVRRAALLALPWIALSAISAHSQTLPEYPQAGPVGMVGPATGAMNCPPAGQCRCGVICTGTNCRGGGPGWGAQRPIPWQLFAQGEYVGPARISHVPEYRLRVDDILEFVYRITAKQVSRPYRLEVFDRVRVRSLSADELDQEVSIQPDGSVTLPFLGQVPAAGRTVDELRAALNELFKSHFKTPNILVVPLKFNTRLEELRAAIDSRYSISGGQTRRVRVTPEGTVQLPAIGSVFVQGLTLSEAKREVDERYAQLVDGMEITPILAERAPRYVFVLGEVRAPGRYTLEGPTTVMQSIAMAGSWNVGSNLRHIVIFRRDDCWRLMATRVDLQGALLGHRPCPADEIWLRDSDIVMVPKSALLVTDDMINLLFTRGLYSLVPVSTTLQFSKLSTL